MDRLMTLQKERIALRFWLQGRKFHMALETMEYAASFHTGLRKDGVTPEFAHQISIACHIRNLESHLILPEETIATVFLHDVMEDFDIPKQELARRFGQVVSEASYSVTKVYLGVKRSTEEVFDDCSRNAIGSVVKGGDRGHNHRSMVGVFSLSKQIEYLSETEEYILPMLKKARRNFPAQEPVYNMLKYALSGEVDLIRSIHRAMEPEIDVRVIVKSGV